MVLYFDSYITDVPLKGRDRSLLKEDIRKNSSTYAMPKRLDIAKYVLASYAQYPWSHVLIKYELENSKDNKAFDKYLRSLFPKITIIHHRSADQKEYKKSLKLLESLDDPWIFYSPNNDHPLVSPDPQISKYIDKLITKAEKWKKKYKYVSIMYSHFSEFITIPLRGTPEHFLHGQDTKILEEDELTVTYIKPEGDFSSVQIVHVDQMKQWFSSADVGDKRVIRAEDTLGSVKIDNHVVIAPKREICAHFDGYEHMVGQPNEIPIDQIPPLFLPKGFFHNKIKIAYGYDTYREGWVNINPNAKNYSFRDPLHGADLKISLDEIPYFWKPHINKIDINKNMDGLSTEVSIKRNQMIKFNPWDRGNQSLNIRTLNYWMRYRAFVTTIRLRKIASRIKSKII